MQTPDNKRQTEQKTIGEQHKQSARIELNYKPTSHTAPQTSRNKQQTTHKDHQTTNNTHKPTNIHEQQAPHHKRPRVTNDDHQTTKKCNNHQTSS